MTKRQVGVRVDRVLWKALQKAAIDDGRPLGVVVEEAIAGWLAARDRTVPAIHIQHVAAVKDLQYERED